MKTLFTIAMALALVAPIAEAQTVYKQQSINTYSTVTAGVNTNNLYFDNSAGYPVLTAWRLPRKFTDGITFQHTFQCATVTLAAVQFVYQGSVDGTNYHSIPGSALVAHIPASASTANNTNVVYSTNFSQSALQGWNYIRLAGITNGNAADMTGIVISAGYWEP